MDMRHHLVSVLHTCPDMAHLKQILTKVTIFGFWLDNFVVSRLMAFCATSDSGDLSYAHILFHQLDCPSAYAYNVLIRGYSNSRTPIQSLYLFRDMLQRGIYADKHVFPFVLKACTRANSFLHGRLVHSLLVKCGLEGDMYVQTSLLHMYASLGCIASTKRVFNEMPERSMITWNAIISCYMKSKREMESLELFGKMLREKVEMNADTFVSVLSCCASLGTLIWGKCVHGFIIRRNVNLWSRIELGTSLVHMYVKCGSLGGGVKVFKKMDVQDVSSWTTMIGGFAIHGHGREAISLFNEMVQGGVEPDSVTFTSVLHACSHSGMVDEGLKIYNNMINDYGIESRMEHYGCMVDLLGRAGLIREAEKFIESMPFEPNEAVWGSLVNACVINGELRFGDRIRKGLFELGLEKLTGAHYVVISNVHAKCGRWNAVRRVREVMVEKGVKKACGYSFIEVNGRVQKFLVGDTTHYMITEIYNLLYVITQEIKLAACA